MVVIHSPVAIQGNFYLKFSVTVAGNVAAGFYCVFDVYSKTITGILPVFCNKNYKSSNAPNSILTVFFSYFTHSMIALSTIGYSVVNKPVSYRRSSSLLKPTR